MILYGEKAWRWSDPKVEIKFLHQELILFFRYTEGGNRRRWEKATGYNLRHLVKLIFTKNVKRVL